MSERLDKALSGIKDERLARDVHDLLARLQRLPEGSTGKWGGFTSHGKAGSKAPTGVELERRSEDAMSADVSLWAHYAFRFGRAALTNNEIEIRRLLIEATREYEDFRKRPDNNRIALQQERTEAKDTELLLAYGEGKHASVLAAENLWPVGWVRIIRERNGKDPEYGFDRPAWREMGDGERYELCGELQSEGLSQREAALRIGVS